MLISSIRYFNPSGSNGIYVDYEKDGYLIYPLVPSVRTVEDNVTLGFKTYMQSGTLITFISPDGQYWALKLVRTNSAFVGVLVAYAVFVSFKLVTFVQNIQRPGSVFDISA